MTNYLKKKIIKMNLSVTGITLIITNQLSEAKTMYKKEVSQVDEIKSWELDPIKIQIPDSKLDYRNRKSLDNYYSTLNNVSFIYN